MNSHRSIWTTLRQRGTLIFLTFVLVSAAALARWLALPWFLHPYVRVPSTAFSVTVRCVPSQLRVYSKTSYVSLLNAQLILSEISSHTVVGSYNLPVAPGPRAAEAEFVLLPSADEIEKASSQFNENTAAIVAFQFSRVPSLDLARVELTYAGQKTQGGCEPEELKGRELKNRIIGTSPRTMRFLLIQDELSDFLLAANEFGGNLLLCALVISFFWVLTLGVGGFVSTYLPDRALMRLVTKSDPAALSQSERSDLVEAVRRAYSKLYHRLAFARVVGPATGFLLTVTSLVAGLHPSVVAAQDTFHFISSLQLALVATFMGLAVRIAAEFAIRFHRETANRRLDIIG